MAPRLGIGVDEYRRCAAAGMSLSETARELGVKPQTVKKVGDKNGLTFPKGYMTKEKRDGAKAKGHNKAATGPEGEAHAPAGAGSPQQDQQAKGVV